MGKRILVSVALLAAAASMLCAIQTAEIDSRHGGQTGIVGGYHNDADYIGGFGGIYELELALSKDFSLSADAGGGYNMVDGPLAGGGLDFKYRFLKLKSFDFSAIAYGRGCYLFSPQEPSYYFYGGGALLAATTRLGKFACTLGGGASYDVYGNTKLKLSDKGFGPVGMASLSYALSKKADLGAAFEYGGDRFFLGAYMDFAIDRSKAAPAPKKAPPKAPKKK